LSTQERTQPTLPGVEEQATPTMSLVDDGLAGGQAVSSLTTSAPRGSSSVPADRPLARAEQRDAPFCYNCGNHMQRAGSCYVCGSCGTTSGCS
jgi:ribonucleoside-diphosphate reductase alpha chain